MAYLEEFSAIDKVAASVDLSHSAIEFFPACFDVADFAVVANPSAVATEQAVTACEAIVVVMTVLMQATN